MNSQKNHIQIGYGYGLLPLRYQDSISVTKWFGSLAASSTPRLVCKHVFATHTVLSETKMHKSEPSSYMREPGGQRLSTQPDAKKLN